MSAITSTIDQITPSWGEEKLKKDKFAWNEFLGGKYGAKETTCESKVYMVINWWINISLGGTGTESLPLLSNIEVWHLIKNFHISFLQRGC